MSILMLIILFIFPVFFLCHKNQAQSFHLLLEPVFKFCINPDKGEVFCVRENQDAFLLNISPVQ